MKKITAIILLAICILCAFTGCRSEADMVETMISTMMPTESSGNNGSTTNSGSVTDGDGVIGNDDEETGSAPATTMAPSTGNTVSTGNVI